MTVLGLSFGTGTLGPPDGSSPPRRSLAWHAVDLLAQYAQTTSVEGEREPWRPKSDGSRSRLRAADCLRRRSSSQPRLDPET
jgi:hypothetical protein